MNATIERFGHPGTLIREYRHWVLLLRPAAPTLGAMVLAAKGEATRYGALETEAFAEQGQVVATIERALDATVRPERINYLMLMMVDPHVHFHVLPRYNGTRSRGALTIADTGWPKTPDLGHAVTLDADTVADHVAWLRRALD